MTRNEGTIDRALRILLGLVLLSLVFIGPQTPWGWVGLVPLITGLVGSCSSRSSGSDDLGSYRGRRRQSRLDRPSASCAASNPKVATIRP